MVITLEQVKAHLTTMGYIASDYTLAAFISIANTIDESMQEAGYSDDVQALIKLYCVVVMLSNSDVQRVSSQSAASGSRSFQYFDDGRASLLKMIAMLDPNNCVSILPIQKGESITQFNVSRG